MSTTLTANAATAGLSLQAIGGLSVQAWLLIAVSVGAGLLIELAFLRAQRSAPDRAQRSARDTTQGRDSERTS